MNINKNIGRIYIIVFCGIKDHYFKNLKIEVIYTLNLLNKEN